MRKTMKVLGVAMTLLAGLFWISGRSRGDFFGLVKASADRTLEVVEEQLPAEVHERRLDHELQRFRGEILDRQVQLQLSQNRLGHHQGGLERLSAGLRRRETLLADAFPALQNALTQQQERVKFANQEYSLADFQRELDNLLAQQEHESRLRDEQHAAATRLQEAHREAERALDEMRRTLTHTEQQVTLLRQRRDQAGMESRTLELLAGISAARDKEVSPVMQGLHRLTTEVEVLEARNSARRAVIPIPEASAINGVDRAWNRLRELQAIHDAAHQQERRPASSKH